MASISFHQIMNRCYESPPGEGEYNRQTFVPRTISLPFHQVRPPPMNRPPLPQPFPEALRREPVRMLLVTVPPVKPPTPARLSNERGASP